MQVAYQFPELVDRLVLVSSGGLGREVSVFLRAVDAARLGARAAADRLAAGARRRRRDLARARPRSACRPARTSREIARGIASLNEVGARRAFVHTARSVIDAGGQRVDARDRLYLAEADPVAARVGRAIDPIIPAAHGVRAHELMPGSRLELFDARGPLPAPRRPLRFVRCCATFVATTEPARRRRRSDARELMLARAAGLASSAMDVWEAARAARGRHRSRARSTRWWAPGTLVTFPTLLAFGYPPVLANVTNNIGLVPGSVSGAWAYRRELAGQRSRVLRLAGCLGRRRHHRRDPAAGAARVGVRRDRAGADPARRRRS